MIRPVLAATALPFLLGGCATSTSYPPLYSAPTIARTAGDGTLKAACTSSEHPLDQTLACAEILQDVYSTGYSESARWQDISQLPIIGAAAAAAWILLKDKENAAKKVGKVGIGALAYSAARDQLLPKDMPVIFIKGHSALGCVLAEEIYFRGTAADDSFAALNGSLLDTARQANKVSALRYSIPSDPAASPELLKAAQSLADQAIAAANTQLRASRQERAAHEFANSPFRRSVSDIAAWVASKGRTRPNASYEALLQGMSSAPTGAKPPTTTQGAVPPPPPPPPPPEPQRNSAELIRKIGEESQKLTGMTIDLQGNTPPYGARLVQVTNCATDLPSG